MATSGPSPGLGVPVAPAASSLPPNPFSSRSPLSLQKGQDDSQRSTGSPHMYGRGTLLALSSSPLVQRPSGMAPLSHWYGEWEPYHHKSMPYQYRDLPRRNAEEAAPVVDSESADTVSSGGIIGGALGGFGPKREGGGARFGRRYEERGERSEGLRLGEVGSSRRFLATGKNPFGQISASGTFKPAGAGLPGQPRGPRDGGLDSPDGRRFTLSERSASFGKDRNRDRDVPHLAGMGEERIRGARERFGDDRSGSGRERRRGLDADEEREEAEYQDNLRARRAGGADLASDWRKSGDKGGVASGRMGQYANGDRARGGDRLNRERGGKGMPSWMGEGDNDSPAWMDDETSSPLATPSKAGFDAFGRRRDPEPEPMRLPNDLGGAVDSIQAFKAQMKERERLEREREGGDGSNFRSGEYDFGASSESKDQERAEAAAALAAYQSQGQSERGGSAPPPGLYDTISNSHGSGSNPDAPPSLPGRSSRFAGFFGGRTNMRDPQAAALAAQQKLLESRGEKAPASPGVDGVANADKEAAQPAPSGAASSFNIADLFNKQNASNDDGADDQQRHKPGQNPSEADIQSMQKLMAMLQSGGTPEPRTIEGRGSNTPLNNNHGGPRPDSAGALREMLGGGNQRSNGMSEEEQRRQHSQQIMSPNMTSPSVPHGYGGPPPGMGSQQQQSHSPGIQPTSPYSDPRGQQPPGFGSRPGEAPYGFPDGRPPFGLDPRMMGRMPMGPPGPGQLPPHIAAALGLGRPPPPPPPGLRGPPPFANFPPPFAGRPPPPGMPPQMYQQLMSMPPHMQQQLLAGGPPMRPPRSPYELPMQQGQPPQQQGPPVGSQSVNGANLMALLRGGPGSN